MANPFLQNFTPGLKAVIFLPLTFVLGILFSGLAILVMGANMGIGYKAVINIIGGDFTDPNSMIILRWANAFNQVGSFIVASLVFILLFGRKSVNDLWMNRGSWMLLFIPFFMIFTMSQIEWTVRLNDWLIPEGGLLEQWMKPLEEKAAEMTERMMTMDGIGDLVLNLLFFAVLPAVGEEMAFRGVLQSQIAKSTKNIHLAIWLTAIIFSAYHMQFYGFLPRMLLGAVFGYLLIWSGSLWAPILAHFTNNALAVITYYVVQSDPSFAEGQLESEAVSPFMTIISVVIFVGFLMLFNSRSIWHQISGKYLHFDQQSIR